jgi:hypothetical protein
MKRSIRTPGADPDADPFAPGLRTIDCRNQFCREGPDRAQRGALRQFGALSRLIQDASLLCSSSRDGDETAKRADRKQ